MHAVLLRRLVSLATQQQHTYTHTTHIHSIDTHTHTAHAHTTHTHTTHTYTHNTHILTHTDTETDTNSRPSVLPVCRGRSARPPSPPCSGSQPPHCRCGAAPTRWTIHQQDGPNHLGLWCNFATRPPNGTNHLGLCALQETLPVEDRVPWSWKGESRPTAAIPMENPYCSCGLTRPCCIFKAPTH